MLLLLERLKPLKPNCTRFGAILRSAAAGPKNNYDGYAGVVLSGCRNHEQR